MRGFLVQPDSLCLADTGGACTVFRRRRRRRRTNCCRAFSSRPSTLFWSPDSRHLLFTTRTPPHVTDGRTGRWKEKLALASRPPVSSPVRANRRTLRVCCPARTEPWMPAGKKVWSQCTTTERCGLALSRGIFFFQSPFTRHHLTWSFAAASLSTCLPPGHVDGGLCDTFRRCQHRPLTLA